MSIDYDNWLKRYLAKIRYGINSGHQKHDSAPFCCLSLKPIEVVTEGLFCVKSEQAFWNQKVSQKKKNILVLAIIQDEKHLVF